MDGWHHGELSKITPKARQKGRTSEEKRGFGGSGVTLGHHVGPKGWQGHFCDDFWRILVSFWDGFWTSFLKILTPWEGGVHKVILNGWPGKVCLIFWSLLVSIVGRFCDFLGGG